MLWQRKRHGDTLARIESLKAGLQDFERVSSLLFGFALGICADQHADIQAAERSAMLAQEAVAKAS